MKPLVFFLEASVRAVNAPEKMEEIFGNTDITAEVATPQLRISPQAASWVILVMLPTKPIRIPRIRPRVIGSPMMPSFLRMPLGSIWILYRPILLSSQLSGMAITATVAVCKEAMEQPG